MTNGTVDAGFAFNHVMINQMTNRSSFLTDKNRLVWRFMQKHFKAEIA